MLCCGSEMEEKRQMRVSGDGGDQGRKRVMEMLGTGVKRGKE